MMVVGPRLGTLLGTLAPTTLAVKYFAWDDAKNATLRADRSIGFEDIIPRLANLASIGRLRRTARIVCSSMPAGDHT
jgi:hypothetical protein